jgi:hypothetical protein
MCHVWLGGSEGDVWGWGKGKGAVKMGRLILSMGLVWAEVRILVQRATTPSKRFFLLHFLLHFSFTKHVLKPCYKRCKFDCVSKTFFPLQVKNEPVTEV